MARGFQSFLGNPQKGFDDDDDNGSGGGSDDDGGVAVAAKAERGAEPGTGGAGSGGSTGSPRRRQDLALVGVGRDLAALPASSILSRTSSVTPEVVAAFDGPRQGETLTSGRPGFLCHLGKHRGRPAVL